jgi:hypothetical protein
LIKSENALGSIPTLQYSSAPSLRLAEVEHEDDDEHENEAPIIFAG